MSKNGEKDDKSSKCQEPAIELINTSGRFVFPNGDVYEGEYCAHRIGLCWREGHGTYKTKDGHVYEGDWIDDKLAEKQELKIIYPNNAKYFGGLSKNKYSGPGLYILENGLPIVSSFVANQPRGDIILIDPYNSFWNGVALGNSCILFPENQFFSNVNQERGKGKSKIQKKNESVIHSEDISEEIQLSDRELEKIIFAKSTKTPLELDFVKSLWYQNYNKFKQRKKRISCIINLMGIHGLNEKDKKWYNKYIEYKREIAKKSKNSVKKSEVDLTLLQKYFSDDFQQAWPAMNVFYPFYCLASSHSKFEEEEEEVEDEEQTKNKK